jgi:hypothetical protein
MKIAQIRQRRTLADGTRMVNIVCPFCEHHHWIRDGVSATCLRKPGRFSIGPR